MSNEARMADSIASSAESFAFVTSFVRNKVDRTTLQLNTRNTIHLDQQLRLLPTSVFDHHLSRTSKSGRIAKKTVQIDRSIYYG